MAGSIWNVEDFDPAEWKIEREGREWKGEEFDKRIYQAPEKIEYVGGIFINERQRLTVLVIGVGRKKCWLRNAAPSACRN